ncbi:unnamed protein product [Darwinula stevensoni]|uniref:Uncharacterized protein n=1 Tax=Darwinula stevensoni TaxID=69355 RepID=A0A7R8XAH8_9CRUS|nr:unnamed protein product [Darwinula stevensoni]CAG0885593.1 unnamed protein product [Darwinula stevensoni]
MVLSAKQDCGSVYLLSGGSVYLVFSENTFLSQIRFLVLLLLWSGVTALDVDITEKMFTQLVRANATIQNPLLNITGVDVFTCADSCTSLRLQYFNTQHSTTHSPLILRGILDSLWRPVGWRCQKLRCKQAWVAKPQQDGGAVYGQVTY